jgi:hypothetical protein
MGAKLELAPSKSDDAQGGTQSSNRWLRLAIALPVAIVVGIFVRLVVYRLLRGY